MTNNISKSIGEKIKRFRKLNKITQMELAEKTEMDYRHLQDMESGRVNVKISTIEKLADQFDVPLCQFVKPIENRVTPSEIALYCSNTILEMNGVGVMLVDIHGAITSANKVMLHWISGSTVSFQNGHTKIWDLMSTTPFQGISNFSEEAPYKKFIDSPKIQTFNIQLENPTQKLTMRIQPAYNSKNSCIGLISLLLPESF